MFALVELLGVVVVFGKGVTRYDFWGFERGKGQTMLYVPFFCGLGQERGTDVIFYGFRGLRG